jgi:hypothetical protein
MCIYTSVSCVLPELTCACLHTTTQPAPNASAAAGSGRNVKNRKPYIVGGKTVLLTDEEKNIYQLTLEHKGPLPQLQVSRYATCACAFLNDAICCGNLIFKLVIYCSRVASCCSPPEPTPVALSACSHRLCINVFKCPRPCSRAGYQLT